LQQTSKFIVSSTTPNDMSSISAKPISLSENFELNGLQFQQLQLQIALTVWNHTTCQAILMPNYIILEFSTSCHQLSGLSSVAGQVVTSRPDLLSYL